MYLSSLLLFVFLLILQFVSTATSSLFATVPSTPSKGCRPQSRSGMLGNIEAKLTLRLSRTPDSEVEVMECDTRLRLTRTMKLDFGDMEEEDSSESPSGATGTSSDKDPSQRIILSTQRKFVYRAPVLFDLTDLPDKTAVEIATLRLSGFQTLANIFDTPLLVKDGPLPQLGQFTVDVHAIKPPCQSDYPEMDLLLHSKLKPGSSESVILDVRSLVSSWHGHPDLNCGFHVELVLRQSLPLKLNINPSLNHGRSSKTELDLIKAMEKRISGRLSRPTPVPEVSRLRRSVDQVRYDHKAAMKKSCQKYPMNVSFKDIGWDDWIVAPQTIHTSYCAGYCHFPMSAAVDPTNNAILRSLFHLEYPDKLAEPCCVPVEFETIDFLEFVNNSTEPVRREIEHMHVKTCGCR